MKFGIEFELIVYSDDCKYINNFLQRCKNKNWLQTEDGSLRIEHDEEHNFKQYEDYEIITPPYSKINKFLCDFDYIFNHEYITINETTNKTKLRIDFNYSTGTHIHWSNFSKKLRFPYLNKLDKISMYEYLMNEDNIKEDTDYWTDKDWSIWHNKQENKFIEWQKKYSTPELMFFNKKESINLIYETIKNLCKYNSVVTDFIRNCVREEWNASDRYSFINTSNDSDYGTIEFRMFNLHGIKTVDIVKDAIIHFINILNLAILIAYKKEAKCLSKKFEKKEFIEANNRLVQDLYDNGLISNKRKHLLSPRLVKQFTKRVVRKARI